MKKYYSILQFFLVLFLIACAEKDYEDIKINNAKRDINSTISIPDAIKVVEQLFPEKIGETRSSIENSVLTLKKSDLLKITRGSDGASELPAIYIIPTEDDGCAVVGADKRMKSIYAVLDNTKLTVDDICNYESLSNDTINEKYAVSLLGKTIAEDSRAIIRDPIDSMPMILRPTIFTRTVVEADIDPMLRTVWGPGFDYNNVRIQCIPIAAAQLFYKNRYPLILGFMPINWEAISNNEYAGGSTAGIHLTVTKQLMLSIYHALENLPGDNNSVHTECLATLMSQCGYANVEYTVYSTNSAITMLKSRNLPFVMKGQPVNSSEGHAWVVDGCNVYRVEEVERRYLGTSPFLYEDIVLRILENTQLIHCNFGWGGFSNGYYASGIFNAANSLDDENIDSGVGDASRPYPGADNFTNDLKMIMYNL